MQNPFTHTFGVEPMQYISSVQTEEIINNFSYDRPSEMCYMITGVRGCGKTVMLSKIAESIKSDSWLVYDLNVTRNLDEQLAARLAEHPLVLKHLIKANIDISIAGISVGIKYGKDKIFDIGVLIERMISTLSAHNIRILITLDDVAATKEMREFSHTYQSLIRSKLPVYMIMTGLLGNFREVINNNEFKDCTFLTRAFQINVEPLDISQIAVSYLEVFDITESEAIKLAKMTKGYAFAYQVLGYIFFESREKDDRVSIEFKYTSDLIKYSYAKIWSELSDKEITIIKALVTLEADEHKVKREDVISVISKTEKISSSTFNIYRERLIGKGIISSSNNRDGYYTIELPRFGTFVRQYHNDSD